MIRKATVSDIKRIHKLLQVFAGEGQLLPRPLGVLYDHVRDFAVWEEKPGRAVAGCCALHVCWEDMAEIRSLAVASDCQNKGIGSKLVEFALKEARVFAIKRVFALTYKPGFFEKLGFRVTGKNHLPQKIWADCLQCVKFPDCDEVAVIRKV